MKITGTQINYYTHCHRHLWLFSNKIEMEQNSDNVAIGKQISDNTYKDEQHEIEIDNIKIDFYDSNKKIIHEIKKSDKMEELHIWQLKYYIYVLRGKGIEGVTGKLNYPKLRVTKDVFLEEEDIKRFNIILKDIEEIINGEMPPVINKPFCKQCSYYNLCYI